jgi:hypothetical protein
MSEIESGWQEYAKPHCADDTSKTRPVNSKKSGEQEETTMSESPTRRLT